jgi:hypothetical protein
MVPGNVEKIREQYNNYPASSTVLAIRDFSCVSFTFLDLLSLSPPGCGSDA